MKGIICELQICLTRESEKWCRKTVKVCKSLLQYKTSVHVHCLGQGLFRQAIHAPFLHNIHTVKEPRSGKRSDYAVLSQSMHKPPANKTSVYIRCLGQGLIRQAIHTPVLRLHSYNKRTTLCTEFPVTIPKLKFCHKAVSYHTTEKISLKSRPNISEMLSNFPSMGPQECPIKKGFEYFEHHVLLHGNQYSKKR